MYKAEDDMPFDEKLDHLERVSALQEAERELSQEAARRDATLREVTRRDVSRRDVT